MMTTMAIACSIITRIVSRATAIATAVVDKMTTTRPIVVQENADRVAAEDAVVVVVSWARKNLLFAPQVI
jgi:hypothetical protein